LTQPSRAFLGLGFSNRRLNQRGVNTRWVHSDVRHLAVTDGAMIATFVAIAQFARFGTDQTTFPPRILGVPAQPSQILAWFFRNRSRGFRPMWRTGISTL